MRFATYNYRSLTYFWRTNLSVALGAAVATAALTGALIVGDSMRASLHAVAAGRLGPIDHALVAARLFRQVLASELARDPAVQGHIESVAPALLLRGSVRHAHSGARSSRVNIHGVDRAFWRLAGRFSSGMPKGVSGRNVMLNATLASAIGAQVGDDVLVHTGKPSAISTETLLGRRDDATTTLRLTVTDILPADGIFALDLNPRQVLPQNAFVPLAALQRATDQKNRVNAILVDADDAGRQAANSLDRAIGRNLQLADLGLKLTVNERYGYVALESDAMLIEPAIETAAVAAAKQIGATTSPVLTHLANAIRKVGNDLPVGGSGGTIPYSTVAAVDPASTTAAFGIRAGHRLAGEGDLLLNEWAADDLDARPGDTIEIEYYVTGPLGRLETRTSSFTLRGIVELEGIAADPGFIPEFKGVTDTDNLADWDPPFPVDLSLVREKDEAYWDEYHTTPKAFVSLTQGQKLWADQPERFGRVTSIRFAPPGAAGGDLAALGDQIAASLRERMDPKVVGLTFDPVRKAVDEASKGSTDFGGLFIGFSLFLITSAAILVALLFRLSIEQRMGEIGLLLAVGIVPRTITRQLMAQGLWLSIAGAIIGTVAALAYAALMLTGLRSVWSDAVNAPFLRMAVTPTSLLVGFASSVLVAAGAAALSIRTITRRSPRSLLAGRLEASARGVGRAGNRAVIVAVIAACLAAVVLMLSLVTTSIPPVAGFFASGCAALIAGLAALTHRLKRAAPASICAKGISAMLKLAARNAPRHFGRSVMTASLIAGATFLIVSLEAMRLRGGDRDGGRNSPTGGFQLYAESATPLPYDLNSPAERERLGIQQDLADVEFMPFRLRPGDESSCLNLYKPREPRIIAAPPSMIERGGFRFAKALDLEPGNHSHPWTLLNHRFDDGAVPAIGDEAAVLWQLHLGLGHDLAVRDERGHTIKLRFVALMKGSALQDEIIISQRRFIELFPSINGPAFFLIEAGNADHTSLISALERDLTVYSFDVASTSKRLADYNAVQNTYLSTFQALGGLGLILGTAGLAAVVLRNVWERRRELAIMRAIGFARSAIAIVVLAENVFLVAAGLGIGTTAAVVAIIPPLVHDARGVPLSSLVAVILAAFFISVFSGTAAVRAAVNAPLVRSLRDE